MNIKIDFDNIKVKETRNDFTVKLLMLKGEKGEQGDVNLSQLNQEKNARENADKTLQNQINGLASGSPLVASSTSGMTDTTRVYVNTTDGYWYYYNGSTWVQVGVYQSDGIITDKTLTQDGVAADGEATGDNIERLEYSRIRVGFERGGYILTDGVLTDNDGGWYLNNYRRSRPIKVPAYSRFVVTDSNIRGFIYHSYDNGQTYTQHNWLTTTDFQYIPTQDCLVCFVFDKVTGGTTPTPKECHDGFYIEKPYNTNNYIDLIIEDSELRIDSAVKPHGNFVIGTMYNGIISNHNPSNRIVFTNFFSFNSDIEVKIKTGFRAGFHTFVNGVFVSDSYWKQGTYNINANTTFKMVISRVTEQTETAENWFLDFVNAISFEPKNKIPVIPNISINKPFMFSSRPKFMLHRGLQSEAPENSVPAFTLAGQNGAWGIETDIYETSDGHLVCIHDDTVDRTTDGTGNVRDKTLAQLQALTIDVGSNIEQYPNLKIPTFEQYLQICKLYNCVAFIEIKGVTNISGLIDLVKKYGMLYKSVYIVWENLLNTVRGVDQDAIVPCLLNGYNSIGNYETVINSAKKYPNVMVGLEAGENVTDSVIELAHENNIVVGVWTVNDLSTAKTYFSRGIDMVTTNSLTSLQ